MADLTEIRSDEIKQAVECLNGLLTFRDKKGNLSPIITGYNRYIAVSHFDDRITFSNIHETEAYREDMLRDLKTLGYRREAVLNLIREKTGAFLHDLYFRIRDNRGVLFPDLKIKDMRTGEYLDLEEYEHPLIEYTQFKGADGYLIAEGQGWELDLPFRDKRELLRLVDLFLNKSGKYVYDKNGEPIGKTEAPWTDAYEMPVLLLGEMALKYACELQDFIPATRFVLRKEPNEISFVIHRNLEMLKSVPQYERLLSLGFVDEPCLGNRPFILEYVDKNR